MAFILGNINDTMQITFAAGLWTVNAVKLFSTLF